MTTTDSGVYNGMPASQLGEWGWERPWSGTSGGQCVEMKRLGDGRVAVRQSTDPAGPALIYTPEEIGAFLTGVKNGLADHMTADHKSAEHRASDHLAADHRAAEHRGTARLAAAPPAANKTPIPPVAKTHNRKRRSPGRAGAPAAEQYPQRRA